MLAISKRKPEIQRRRFVVDRAWFLRNLIGFVHASDTGLLRPVNSPGPNPAEQFYLRPLPAPGCGCRACRGEAAEREVPVAVFPPERARPGRATDLPRRQWVGRDQASVRWTLTPVNGRATDGTPQAFERSRDSASEERLGPVPKRGEDSDTQRRSAGRRAPVLQAQHDCLARQGFTACLSNKCSVHVWTGAHLKSTLQS